VIDIANLQQELNEKGFVDIAHGLTIFYEPESHKYRLTGDGMEPIGYNSLREILDYFELEYIGRGGEG
jgi:hypothetical protein